MKFSVKSEERFRRKQAMMHLIRILHQNSLESLKFYSLYTVNMSILTRCTTKWYWTSIAL